MPHLSYIVIFSCLFISWRSVHPFSRKLKSKLGKSSPKRNRKKWPQKEIWPCLVAFSAVTWAVFTPSLRLFLCEKKPCATIRSMHCHKKMNIKSRQLITIFEVIPLKLELFCGFLVMVSHVSRYKDNERGGAKGNSHNRIITPGNQLWPPCSKWRRWQTTTRGFTVCLTSLQIWHRSLLICWIKHWGLANLASLTTHTTDQRSEWLY